MLSLLVGLLLPFLNYHAFFALLVIRLIFKDTHLQLNFKLLVFDQIGSCCILVHELYVDLVPRIFSLIWELSGKTESKEDCVSG